MEIDTLFVGGGPSTLGVMANAYQSQRIDYMVLGQNNGKNKNGHYSTDGEIAIIESSEQFGGGNLQRHYGIKSNTSAVGFLKVLMYPKTKSAINAKRSSQSLQ